MTLTGGHLDRSGPTAPGASGDGCWPSRQSTADGRPAGESTIAQDPVLRLHAARYTSLRADATPLGLSPVHPAFGPDTLAVPPRALLTPSGPGGRPAIRDAVGGRDDKDLDDLDYFVEFMARPVVAVFRTLLDRHGTLIETDGAGAWRYELSGQGQPTGRVLLAAPGPRGTPTVAAVTAAVTALHDVLRALAHAVAGDAGADARVDAVVAEELRFLRPRTVALLAGRHPWRTYAHAVPAEQDAVLRGVLDRVRARAQARRDRPALPPPTVVIDVDCCALVPTERAVRALRELRLPTARGAGGKPVPVDPGAFAVLPSDSRPAWDRFVRRNGLDLTCPGVDWAGAYAEFLRGFYRPWDRLRTDRASPGLTRFVRDVERIGGVVVLNTGRRDRVRAHTRDVLGRYGIGHLPLLTQPDDRTAPVADLKVVNLKRGGPWDVVAVFDDNLANRRAMAAAYPEALVVAVEPPNFTSDRPEGAPPADRAPLIATFERLPDPLPPSWQPAGPQLSYAQSVAGLHLPELRPRLAARSYEVRLSNAQSTRLVARLLDQARGHARNTAEGARRWLRQETGAAETADAAVARLVHHILTRKQFHRGSRSRYPLSAAMNDTLPFIRRGQPIRLVLVAFPLKQSSSGLKVEGDLPDLAELAALVRLVELRHTIEQVYPPGIRLRILTDPTHYRNRPPDSFDAYQRKLREYRRLVGADDFVSFTDVDEAAYAGLGLSPATRRTLVERYRQEYRTALAGLDITDQPLRTLARAAVVDPGADGQAPPFRAIFTSLLHSVAVPGPPGPRMTWFQRVYADVYQLDGEDPAEVLAARRQVLRVVWADTIDYLAAARADHALGYDRMFPDRVRLTVNQPRQGRCGFAPLGGSVLLPWHGTAAVTRRGEISVDFVVSLRDQGFVPVYSPLLDGEQAWFFVPVTNTLARGDRGAEIEPALLDAIRLRRR